MEAGPNDLVLREDIEEGSYSVELSDIEDHCTLQSENPVQIEIVAEETAETEFEVNCKGIFRKKIVFFRNQGGSTKAMNSMAQQSYFVMNYDGSDVEKVNEFSLDGRINFSSDVSPDGTKMVVIYLEEGGADARIAIVEAYNNKLIFLNDLTEGVSYFYPVFSPDGSKIAYIKTSDSFKKKDIYVMDSDGSNVVQLTNTDELEDNLDWSPDGTKIVFQRSSKNYKYQGLFTINNDGTGEKMIHNSEIELTNPLWSPNGDKIAVVGSQSDPFYYHEIYVMNSDGSNVQKILSKKGHSIYYSSLVWSPDGNKIAFLSNRDGMPDEEFGYAYEPMDIFMMNADGSNLTNMTNTSDSNEANLMITP